MYSKENMNETYPSPKMHLISLFFQAHVGSTLSSSPNIIRKKSAEVIKNFGKAHEWITANREFLSAFFENKFCVFVTKNIQDKATIQKIIDDFRGVISQGKDVRKKDSTFSSSLQCFTEAIVLLHLSSGKNLLVEFLNENKKVAAFIVENIEKLNSIVELWKEKKKQTLPSRKPLSLLPFRPKVVDTRKRKRDEVEATKGLLKL